MAAARTIPDPQKRRTCIALIMSYKIVVTETLRWHRRTAEAKRVASSAEPVRMFALRVASIHLRKAHIDSYVNLINSPHRLDRINSHFTVIRTPYCHPSWSDRPSPWRLGAHLSAVQPGSSESALHYASARRGACSHVRRTAFRFHGASERTRFTRTRQSRLQSN